MNTQWKVKNIIITNTGKYNKKAGREEEKKKKKKKRRRNPKRIIAFSGRHTVCGSAPL